MGTRLRTVSRGGQALFALSMLAHTAAVAQTDPGGTLIVVNKSEATASVIDVASGRTVALLPTGEGPHEVALSHDGRTAVATNYGRQGGGNSLTVIDVVAASVVSTISLGQYRRPHGVAFLPGDSLLVVTSETSEAVLIVRVKEGSVARALRTGQGGSHMLAVTGDGRTIYTGNISDNTVTELDAVEGQRRLFQVPEQPEAITVSADGSEVWVGSNAHGSVSVVHTQDGSLETPLSGFGFPYRILLIEDRGSVVVPDARENTLRVFERASRREIGRLEFPGAAPQGVTVTPDGRWLFQSLSAEGRVAVVDLESLEVVRHVETGAGPDGLAWSPLASRETTGTAPSAARLQAEADREAVRSLIGRLFEAMREADSVNVRATMADGARFAQLGERNGEAWIGYAPLGGFLAAVSRSEGRWDERVSDVVVQVDGSMASAWTPYTFYLDGQIRHCGVNSIELLRSQGSWKITQLSDTRRTEECPERPSAEGGGP